MSNPFKGWKQSNVEQFNARTSRGRRGPEPEPVPTPGDKSAERLLHYQILEECEKRGWIAFHGSMAHRTHRTVGEPDFIVVASGGRVFFIEAKTRTGKLTQEQAATMHWLNKLGATTAIVRSLQEFLLLIS